MGADGSWITELPYTVPLISRGPRPTAQATWLTELRFYVPLDTKPVISKMFFPANLLAQYWRNQT